GITGLTEVHITSSITTVEDGAFSDCPNLTAITMYDNLRQVSDASFAGSPVQTVRLCAATSPRYIDSYIAFGKKFERLVTTADTERIIIVAGSSKYWGLDCDYMESLLDGRYSVVNYGTSVGMNIMFFLEAVSSYLTETDVLVYSPELYGPNSWQTNGNTELPSATFQGIANSYNLLERVDASRYPGFFSSFAEFVAGRLQMGEVRWDSYSDSIDQYGDYTKFRTELNDPEYYLGVMGDFRFDENGVPPEYLPELNRVLDHAAESGAQILFSFPPYNKNAVADGYLNDTALDYYMDYIRENIHARLISDVRNYIHEGQYFDDSDYHLNAIGRPIHTEQLTKDLAAIGIELSQ
ncbi:MAG: leucine-rich repeat protein, partial [Clostridia bacterium]|nr:leucine-rich repeat protein [Clostridia bacterium]